VANAALSRANADLKVFAGAASHDLSEPLRTISVYSQLLIKAFHEGDQPAAERSADTIIECTGRMGRLLSDLSEYTELNEEQADAGAPIDLNLALQKALEDLKAMIDQT